LNPFEYDICAWRYDGGMPLDLRGAQSKIQRAKKHIKDFDTERLTFLDSNPYVVVAMFDPEANVTQSILGPVSTIPEDLALIAGDAAHCLRIALDYLACEIVRSSGSDVRNVYFPICETADKYEAESPGKTKGMPVAAKEIIDSIKPYEGGSDALWALHSLDVTDKHRLLITVGAQLATTMQLKLSPEPTEFSMLFRAPRGLEEGDVLGEVSGNSEADQRINFSFDIAFGKPDGFAGEPVVETLTYMTRMFEAIVSHFEGLF
jgi:hypothetical protein